MHYQFGRSPKYLYKNNLWLLLWNYWIVLLRKKISENQISKSNSTNLNGPRHSLFCCCYNIWKLKLNINIGFFLRLLKNPLKTEEISRMDIQKISKRLRLRRKSGIFGRRILKRPLYSSGESSPRRRTVDMKMVMKRSRCHPESGENQEKPDDRTLMRLKTTCGSSATRPVWEDLRLII